MTNDEPIYNNRFEIVREPSRHPQQKERVDDYMTADELIQADCTDHGDGSTFEFRLSQRFREIIAKRLKTWRDGRNWSRRRVGLTLDISPERLQAREKDIGYLELFDLCHHMRTYAATEEFTYDFLINLIKRDLRECIHEIFAVPIKPTPSMTNRLRQLPPSTHED